MSIHGWKQLAIWSLEHACLDPEERNRALAIFSREWEKFCTGVVHEHGEFAKDLPELDAVDPRG